MNQLCLCSVGAAERALPQCSGSQREEAGSAEDVRECRAGQMCPGEVTLVLQ